MEFAAGQRWTYRSKPGLDASRIVIGAIVSFDGGQKVICAAVTGLPPRPAERAANGVVIPFLPFAEAAFAATVVMCDGEELPPSGFAPALDAWVRDSRGQTRLTVPFDGSLDRLVALQMADIAGASAAAIDNQPVTTST